MRFTFTFFLCLLLSTSAWAQINTDSPFPVDFVITAPAAIAGSYPYGTQTSNIEVPDIWGPILSEDLSGEVVWARDMPGGEFADSLCCEMVTMDLTDKIAFIRRGECDFSAKVFNAQEAGASAVIIGNHSENEDDGPETLVGMLGIENAALVTIPAVFVSRNTAAAITGQLDAGETVSAVFDVRAMYNPFTVWSYHTPVADFVPLPGIRINFANIESDDEELVTITTTITAPSNAETVLTGSASIVPEADSVIIMDGEFIPDEIGEHTITFTNDQNDEVVETNFVVTEFTYALDSNDEMQFAVGPTEEDFADALRYDAGALIVTDEDGAMARYASFGLGNAAELFAEGGEELPTILITLYDADGDDDGQLDFSDPNAGANSDFTELSAVAFAEYRITGEEGENEMIFVELEDLLTSESPITLQGNEFYYLVITYDDLFSGIGIAPTYTSSTAVDYPFFALASGGSLPVTPIITSQFFNGGWGGRTVAVRLHLDGFAPPITSTEDLTILEGERVTIAPNPVGDQLNVQFDLEGVAGETQIGIFGADGRQYGLHRFEAIANAPVQLDVKNLAAGTYFLSIHTPAGYRMEKFIKL